MLLPQKIFIVFILIISGLNPFINIYGQTVSKDDKLIEHFDTLISRYRYSNPDSALYLVKKGLSVANSLHDKQGRALMLNQLGMINDNQGKYTEAKDNYTEAFNLYQSLKQYKGMATETYRFGVVEERQGNYDKSIAKYLKALQYSETINDKHGIIEANVGLTNVYFLQKYFNNALHYLQKANSINKTLPFSNLTLTIANAFGVYYSEMGELDKAMKYVQDGLPLSNKPQFNGSNITLLNTLASIYTKQGKIQAAIVLQKQALNKSTQINNYLRVMESLFNLATSYEKIDKRQSLAYLLQARKLALSKSSYKQAIMAMQSLSGIYEQLGDDKNALAYQKELYNISDKIYFGEMAKQINSLLAAYELNKSRLNIQQLQYINNKQKLESRISIGVTISVLVLLFFAGGFYYQLRKVNRSLDDTNHLKDKLLSVLAHDLRSPFGSIISLLDIIDDDDVTPDLRKQLLNELGKSAKTSLATLDSLLKWGQMQIKGIQIIPVRLPIKPAVANTLNLLAIAASNKHITFWDDTPDLTVTADADHFEFVIRNILSNAIKFTNNNGNIWITAQADEGHKMVKLSIKDDGVGISADRIKNVFDLNNVSTNGTLDEKGTSMGLLMCREFMEANHGSINVISELNKGTEFILMFPG